MSGTKQKAPFPYFGGKSSVAPEVWSRLGDTPNYVEPFFGSGAMLLARPHDARIETVNDIDGFVSNFWRAVQADPEAVAKYADWPVNENDLHARHIWLVSQKDSMQARLEGDPDFYDAKSAGWWCWGMCCWIGHGFCSGKGPWRVVDGMLVRDSASEGNGIHRKRVGLQNTRGINRKLVHLGDKGRGVNRSLVHLAGGRGVNRQLVHLGSGGQGINRSLESKGGIYDWMTALSERLRRVRVCCGDWQRVCGDTPTIQQGVTAVFLDPPYSAKADRSEVYSNDDFSVALAVRTWAIERGNNPKFRIALCGYECEHEMPSSWDEWAWKSKGGYESQGAKKGINSSRERIWFSPHCLDSQEPRLPLEFDD